MKFQTVTLQVKMLEVCDRTRVRKNIPQAGSEIVADYADAYRAGLILDPLDVFREKGTERYVVADGEHRLLALLRAKIDKVECRLYEGDEVDALEFAIRCNQKHGLRRTKADVYHAFVRIQETPRLVAKYRTDSELSDQLCISTRTVQAYRAEWRDSPGGDKRVQAKKKSAQERANKKTSKAVKDQRAMMKVSSSQDTETQEETPERPRKSAPEIHAPQRPTVSAALPATPAWTNEDEVSYRALLDTWKSATSAAQKRFRAESL